MNLVFKYVEHPVEGLNFWTASSGDQSYQISLNMRSDGPFPSLRGLHVVRCIVAGRTTELGQYRSFMEAKWAAEQHATGSKAGLTLSDRLAAMADQADSIGRVFSNRSHDARTLNDEGVAQFARLSLLMHSLAQVLRAGCDPFESTKEGDTNERAD